MNVRNILSTVPKFKGQVASAGGFVLRYKRPTVAAVAAALLFGPLILTGDGEIFVLNAVSLVITLLVVRRLTGRRPGRRHKR